MSDGRERGFNRVAGSNALPVLGGKIVESHELLAIFLQTNGGLRIFGLVGSDNQIEGRGGPDSISGSKPVV